MYLQGTLSSVHDNRSVKFQNVLSGRGPNMRCLMFVFLLVLMTGQPTFGQDARNVAKKAFPSTVLLVMEDKNGQPVSQGSGFVVGNGLVATNFHVIAGTYSGFAKLVGKKKQYEISGVLGFNADIDIAILSVVGLNAPILALKNAQAIGETVFAVGNPLGLEGTFSSGIVSGIRRLEGDEVIQITAPISPGSSGGPVLNINAEVIGVATAGYDNGQNLNFAVPARYVTAALEQKAQLQRLPTLNSRKIAKSSLVTGAGEAVESVQASSFRALINRGEALLGKMHLITYVDTLAFSLRNKLRRAIKNVNLVLILRDSSGEPVDVRPIIYRDIIPAGLAKRIRIEISPDVIQLIRQGTGKYNIESRVLDFQYAD